MNEMTHRERILAAITHKPLDRIPMDYWGVSEITNKLYQHFNVKNRLELAKALDLDLIFDVTPKLIADRRNIEDVEYRAVLLPDGSGYYDEPVRRPIEHCESIEDIEACYTFPTTDMFDYSVIPEQCERYKGYALSGGYISLTYFYECIRGTEQMCVDFAVYPEIARYILDRLQDFHYNHVKNILEAAQGKIDVSQVTDDFGSQQGLLISPQMIDKYFADYYAKNIRLVKSYGAHVFHHDDGAIMQALPWLVDKGIEVLNPLQWHLPGWNLSDLKKEYGERLCFHGGIDNQYVLPFGSLEEVRREVAACCETLCCDGTGYILAPCHNIQANTPIEKVLEMYRYAKEFKCK